MPVFVFDDTLYNQGIRVAPLHLLHLGKQIFDVICGHDATGQALLIHCKILILAATCCSDWTSILLIITQYGFF